VRALGPYTYLRSLGISGSGAEVLNSKGKAIRVAKSNLRPFHSPLEATVVVESKRMFAQDS
jgi:hypothetical protein